MFFRNLTIFRFPKMDKTNLMHLLDTGTKECALKPVGPMELSSRGFVPPLGKPLAEDQHLPYWRDNMIWLTVGGEDKLLPGAVINELLRKKLAAIEESEGRKPGGRTRKRIKDELIAELLPRAFVQPRRLDGYIDLDRGLLVVDTASRKQAESFVSEVRRALGSFPALPLNAEVAPRAILTGWIAGDPLPNGLELGDSVQLTSPADDGAKAQLTRQELSSEEVAKHLESGKQVSRLALTFEDKISFTLDESLVVRKFKLLDGAVDSLENTDRDDVEAELDARFFLMTSEAGRLFDVLEKAFKISKLEA